VPNPLGIAHLLDRLTDQPGHFLAQRCRLDPDEAVLPARQQIKRDQ
jgi:hypothetical protein